MKTTLSMLLAPLIALAFATSCRTAGEVKEIQLSACCSASMELVDQMPECCQNGISVAGKLSGCCTDGLLETTDDADRPACCKQTLKLMEDFKACCKTTVFTGQPGPCCETMPEALAANR